MGCSRSHDYFGQSVYNYVCIKAHSDVLRKTHQPEWFFTHAKNTAS